MVMQKQLFILVMAFTLGLSACDKTRDTSEKLGQTVTSTKAIAKQQLQVPNFAGLVKQVGNTVVNITTETNLANMTNQFGIDPNDPFFDLFKRLIPNQPPQPQLRKAFGSGFIISPDGYILTNLHVVNNAKKIIVRTTQKDEFEAKLIGVDPKTDIALLKVAGKNLPTVKIGDPNKLEVGEWVAAIGAPFGFDNSVTQGIVSGKGRSLQKDSYVPFIQTDVPINPGNSGGPLFNLAGEVVGINSQIYSRSGGYMGISFSIPIDIAMSIANQLKTEGKVAHGQLGVQIQAVTSQLARSFALPKVYGALVANIVPGSGAEKAGIKVGDIILEADGKAINDATTLPLIIGSKKPGDKVTLIIFRDGKELRLTVTLSGDDSATDSASSARPDKANNLTIPQFGLTIANINPATLKQLGLSGGVVVVDSRGAAQFSGIIPGDIILCINNKPVHSVSDIHRLIHGQKIVALLISRNGQQMFVTISTGK